MATFTPDDLIFTLSKESNYQSAQTVGISAAMQNGAPYEAVDIELHEAIPRYAMPQSELTRDAVFHILQVMFTQAGVSISPPPLFQRYWCASVAER